MPFGEGGLVAEGQHHQPRERSWGVNAQRPERNTTALREIKNGVEKQ